MSESPTEILGHSLGGVTYRHYAHRALLAFKAIMSLPQPTAFTALVHFGDRSPLGAGSRGVAAIRMSEFVGKQLQEINCPYDRQYAASDDT